MKAKIYTIEFPNGNQHKILTDDNSQAKHIALRKEQANGEKYTITDAKWVKDKPTALK